MCQEILRIADLLSGHHPAVMEEMAECVGDPAQYCRKHETEYPVFQGFGCPVDETDCSCVQWIALTQCLIRYGIAADLDWKCEIEDFLDAMKTCAAVENWKLSLKRAWFDEKTSVEDWCNTLNKKWESSHFAVVELNTYGDNYVILPVPFVAADYLRQWAVKTESGMLQLIPPGLSGNFRELSAFFQRPPCGHVEETGEDNLADQCKICRAHGEWVGAWLPCADNSSQRFQITVSPQNLTAKQLLTISRGFRLSVLQTKKRLSEGKDVRVKNLLIDTLILMDQLEREGTAYSVSPFRPDYPEFHGCSRKRADIENHDSLKYRFDLEREAEWGE